MRGTSGPAIGVAMLVLCLVAFVAAGRVAAHGHVVAGIVIGAVASVAGLVVLLLQPNRRSR